MTCSFSALISTIRGSPVGSRDAAPKILIVGAGAAGTSAAFWLSKATDNGGKNIIVDIFEKNSQAGGSECSVYSIADDTIDMSFHRGRTHISLQ